MAFSPGFVSKFIHGVEKKSVSWQKNNKRRGEMTFHFLRPYWLLMLIPLACALWSLLRYLKKGDSWQRVIDPRLIKHLLSRSSSPQPVKPLLLLGFVWLVSCFALAGPTWDKQPQPVFRNNDAKVILLDLSQSMLAEDIKPNR